MRLLLPVAALLAGIFSQVHTAHAQDAAPNTQRSALASQYSKLRTQGSELESEVDLPTYTAWVREAAIAARRGDRLGLEEAGRRLVAVQVVRLGPQAAPEARLPVDNRWLAAELARPAPDTARLAARLAALADALGLPPGAAPEDARERLRAILSRPPFDRQPETPQWWRDFLDWLARLLERIFRPVTNLPPAVVDPAAWVIAAVGGLLLIGVIVYLLFGLRRALVSGARAREEDPEARLTARSAFDQAGDLARAGDTRTAVRYLYLAALLWLDERALLRYDRALTNREHLDRVRDNPELQRRLAPIVATFDRVWYGHGSLSRDEFAEYVTQVERLRRDL
jgi:hypothetical protein